ncbi:chymotrypsin-elastase inhibitor ixodidin-like [Leptopilina boulardi]|uniref:chymotrypsin-elastase inhibitor ixodidin-like n=1 Tax=Leptopilina boulardi TaxID=63433 RepID=UPI0021F5C7AA|nr:chymotrypsin-elastase inhibitor ixodidin-like [Leptopilina boulardi]
MLLRIMIKMSPFVITVFIVLFVFSTTINVEAGGRCAPDEVWNECGKRLQCQKNCDTLRNPSRIVCTKECVPGCECPRGFVRKSKTDEQCVEERNCR